MLICVLFQHNTLLELILFVIEALAIKKKVYNKWVALSLLKMSLISSNKLFKVVMKFYIKFFAKLKLKTNNLEPNYRKESKDIKDIWKNNL